ncbi:MAG TPA: LCP family protein [Actinocrinis sp.]|nr:LCP family protein [Actinocrinis sp.]
MEDLRPGPGPWRPGWSRRRKVVAATCAALVLILVLLAVAGWLVWRHLNDNIRTADASLAPSSLSGTQNILLVGSDNRAGSDAKYGTAQGARSDTTILLHTPADRREAVAVSIPRDSMVEIPDCARSDGTVAAASFGMFNSAFDTGGISCTVKTVEELTGIRITHFIVLDFTGFVKVVNALGGVRVCVTQPISDTDSGLRLPAGATTLSGEQALAFVRVRHIGNGSDLDRITRQQYFLGELESQVRAAGVLTNPLKTYNVMDAATKAIVTDPGLGSVSGLLGLVDSLNQVPDGKTTYVTVPNNPYPPDPNRVVWSEPGASALWDSLRTAVAPETSGASAGAGGPGADTGIDTGANARGAAQAAATAAGFARAGAARAGAEARARDAAAGSLPVGAASASPSPPPSTSYTCPAS